jgi:hypothetical protein
LNQNSTFASVRFEFAQEIVNVYKSSLQASSVSSGFVEVALQFLFTQMRLSSAPNEQYSDSTLSDQNGCSNGLFARVRICPIVTIRKKLQRMQVNDRTLEEKGF